MSLVDDVKKKKEFYGLSDSIVSRALDLSDGDIKKSRALLRKYFGVFLTNRVLRFAKSRITSRGSQNILGMHMSSRKRDYERFYGDIFSVIGGVGSVIDLGCGVNEFSHKYLPRGISYVGVEAVGQLVELGNNYFKKEDYNGRIVHLDLFDVEKVVDLLIGAEKPRVVFMFQVVDALENFERNFSKRFILGIAKECEWIVLTLPTESLGGRKKFVVQRKWMLDFLSSLDDFGGVDKNFSIKGSFASKGEKIIILKNKK